MVRSVEKMLRSAAREHTLVEIESTLPSGQLLHTVMDPLLVEEATHTLYGWCLEHNRLEGRRIARITRVRVTNVSERDSNTEK